MSCQGLSSVPSKTSGKFRPSHSRPHCLHPIRRNISFEETANEEFFKGDIVNVSHVSCPHDDFNSNKIKINQLF